MNITHLNIIRLNTEVVNNNLLYDPASVYPHTRFDIFNIHKTGFSVSFVNNDWSSGEEAPTAITLKLKARAGAGLSSVSFNIHTRILVKTLPLRTYATASLDATRAPPVVFENLDDWVLLNGLGHFV